MDTYMGFAYLHENIKVPFNYEDGTMTLRCGNMMCPIDDDIQELYADSYSDANGILFHMSLPIATVLNGIKFCGTQKFLMWNVNLKVDYFITNYKSDVKYNKIIFRFEELNRFIPSICNCAFNENHSEYTFMNCVTELGKYSYEYCNSKVELVLRANSKIKYRETCCANSFSEIVISFDNTSDIRFIIGLYRLVKNLFSFLCNRRNVCIQETILEGKVVETFSYSLNGTIQYEEKEIIHEQELNIVDGFQECVESQKDIENTLNYNLVASHFKELLELIRDDKVSIFSIHSSNKYKNLIDLDQSLHITAAFEYYQRTFLPELSSDSSIGFYNDIKALIQDYASKHTGSKKKKANDFIKHLSPPISLKEKIEKTYNGYGSWNGLGNILDEWFKDKISYLAQVANDWRNELAHEKNECQPDRRVIDAVRLVEHINYCIVLRQAHYTDVEIKEIISFILKHP